MTDQTASAPRSTATIDAARMRMLDVIPEVFALVDEECRITWISDGVTEVLGAPPAAVVGTLAFDLFAKQERRDLHRAYFEEVLAAPGRHGPVEVTIARPDGSFLEMEMVLSNQLADPEIEGVMVALRDITHRPGEIEELRRREAWADALIRRGGELILVTDRQGIVSFVNPAAEQVLGLRPDEVVGRCWLDLVEDVSAVGIGRDPRSILEGVLRHPRDQELGVRVRRTDGSLRHLRLYVSDLLGDPDVAGIVINGTDVTDRHVAEDLLAEQAALLEAMARGLPLEETLKWIVSIVEERIPGASPTVGVLDEDGWIRYPVLPSHGADVVVALDRTPPSSDIGTSFRSIGRDPVFVMGIQERRHWQAYRDLLTSARLQSCWTWPTFSNHTGELVGALLVLHSEQRRPAPDERALLDRLMHLAAIAIDRHHLQSTLEHRAHHDPLTGLPNRISLIDRIDQALARTSLSGYSVAVLFVDLDRFKLINDSLGHGVGDVLLEQVGARFRTALRPGDLVGRFGGDEFVVVCENIADETVAVAVADRLREVLLAPFEVAGRQLVVTASIGIAHSTGDARGPEALVRDADVAMYQAKGRGRDTSVVFQIGDQQRVARVLELEHDLRRAIDSGELLAYCQPLVEPCSGGLVGFEALVRWDRPGYGRVMPSELIPVAEESGLILGLGRAVLRQACALAATWVPVDGVAPWISVNVSPRQFSDPRFPGHVAEALDESGLDPSRLCLELTETAFVGDDAVAVSTLVGLKALGVRIAIDDFGTGHASLDYIRRFAVADIVKIDRSFVAGLDDDAGHDRAIVAAVLTLGRALGFSIVAEGVETEGQRAALVELGCDLAQGFLFGRPMPAGDIAAVIAAGRLPLAGSPVP